MNEMTMDGTTPAWRITRDDRADSWSGHARHDEPGLDDAGAASRDKPGKNGGDDDDVVLAALARGIIAARRALGEGFDPALFADPGLDIMLFLFAEGMDGAGVTTNACCGAARVPRTTALRWIKLLADRGLVSSSGDASDRRVTMLHLTASGRTGIAAWLTQAEVMLAPRQALPAR
jgi:hypothetical protein